MFPNFFSLLCTPSVYLFWVQVRAVQYLHHGPHAVGHAHERKESQEDVEAHRPVRLKQPLATQMVCWKIYSVWHFDFMYVYRTYLPMVACGVCLCLCNKSHPWVEIFRSVFFFKFEPRWTEIPRMDSHASTWCLLALLFSLFQSYVTTAYENNGNSGRSRVTWCLPCCRLLQCCGSCTVYTGSGRSEISGSVPASRSDSVFVLTFCEI